MRAMKILLLAVVALLAWWGIGRLGLWLHEKNAGGSFDGYAPQSNGGGRRDPAPQYPTWVVVLSVVLSVLAFVLGFLRG